MTTDSAAEHGSVSQPLPHNATLLTPRPWPENAQATPEQLADWLEVCTRDERVELCSRMLATQEQAHRCLMEDHNGRRWAEGFEAGYRQSVEDNA